LKAEEAVEWPFTVELLDWVEVGWGAREAVGGYDVLTGVVAGCWAVPEEDVVEECCVGGLVSGGVDRGWDKASWMER